MPAEQPKNAPKHVNPLKGPTVVRYRDASRFLWGDQKSGEVADVVYGRNERIATLIYKLKPGGYFKSSDSWKSFFDQHRFYYVLKGELTIQDPGTGEVAVARAGEAVHFRGAKWHFGYNFTADECVVLDWYGPQERPPHVSELEFGATKPKFAGEKPGRSELLGKWPDALASARAEAAAAGGVIAVTKRDALPFIHGSENPVLELLFVNRGPQSRRAQRRQDPPERQDHLCHRGEIARLSARYLRLVRAGRVGHALPAAEFPAPVLELHGSAAVIRFLGGPELRVAASASPLFFRQKEPLFSAGLSWEVRDHWDDRRRIRA
jgi:hypothetical protein